MNRPELTYVGGPVCGLQEPYRGPSQSMPGYGTPRLARDRNGTPRTSRWVTRWCAPGGPPHHYCGATTCPARKAPR